MNTIFHERDVISGGNPIKEIMSLKKIKLVLNSLMMSYFNLDNNNSAAKTNHIMNSDITSPVRSQILGIGSYFVEKKSILSTCNLFFNKMSSDKNTNLIISVGGYSKKFEINNYYFTNDY